MLSHRRFFVIQEISIPGHCQDDLGEVCSAMVFHTGKVKLPCSDHPDIHTPGYTSTAAYNPYLVMENTAHSMEEGSKSSITVYLVNKTWTILLEFLI